MACLPKNSLLLDQPFAVSTLRTAITKLWWNVERIKRLNCIFVGHRAKLFAFHLPQGDGSSAPLFHPLLLFLWRLGEVHVENRQRNLGNQIAVGKEAVEGGRVKMLKG
jgi:hypothetical protein